MSGASKPIAVEAPKGLAARLRDPRVRGVLFQILAAAAFAALIWFVANNAVANLQALGVSTGFDFLNQPAGFDISFSLIPFEPTDTHLRVFWVGMLNTIFVAALGIPAALILGLTMGILRLSPNWLVTRLVGTYVEMVRNVPLLLQIFFWQAVIWTLPPVRNSIAFGDAIFLNKRALYLPKPLFESGMWFVIVAAAAALVLAIILSKRQRAQRDATGAVPNRWVVPGIIILIPAAAILLTGVPWSWELPEAGRFNFSGGIQIPDTLVALWLGLVVYTGAFIAEIVRAGIQSVSKGQQEAALAIGLTPRQTMNLIILPQAVRVIIPPTTSQFLNLTKNSSLAVFIGYPDIVAVFAGTSLNQTGQAIEIIGLSMAFYLVVSLTISFFMNWYNRATALVER